MRTLLVAALLLFCSLGCRPSVPIKKETPSSTPHSDASSPKSVSNIELPTQIASDKTQLRPRTPDVQPTAEESSSESHSAAEAAPKESSGELDAAGQVPAAQPAAQVAQQNWSTERIVLLAQGGPLVVELRVNVGGIDLPSGLAAALQTLATELGIDWDTPPTWDKLLADPLVQSGWLGNLVPTEQQRAQLLNLYDTDGNGQVADAEFRAFITRGMVRNPQLRVVRGPAPTQLSMSTSAWGPLDADSDTELSESELQRTTEILQTYDYDGDRIITQAEVQSTNDPAADRPMARSRDLLDSANLLVFDAKNSGRIANSIFEHYTFTETIDAKEFSAWSPQRLASLDADGDQQITKRELNEWLTLEPDAVLSCTYPNSLEAKPDAAQLQPAETRAGAWISSPLGGRLNYPSCVVAVVVRDDHDPGKKAYLHQMLRAALDDAQTGMMLSTQLELKEGALDLLRQRGEQAVETAWRWTVAPRDWHVTVSWSALQQPWFELLDANGDQRLVESEMARFADSARRWDRDANGTIEADELPLVIQLGINRDDRRGPFSISGGSPSQKRGKNALSAPAWFLGMDYNSDGEITRGEFFGANADFSALDTDGSDGIDAREVYTPP